MMVREHVVPQRPVLGKFSAKHECNAKCLVWARVVLLKEAKKVRRQEDDG